MPRAVGSASPMLRLVAASAAFASLYFLVAVLTGSLVDAPAIPVLWPASGVYLGVMLVAPRRKWPALACAAAAGSTAAYLHAGSSLEVSLAFAVPSSAEGLLGALLIERIAGKRLSLAGLRDLIALVVGAVVATALVALSAGEIAAKTFDASFAESWLRWWSADALGVIAVAPIFAAPFRAARRRLPRGELREAACVVAGVGFAAWFAASSEASSAEALAGGAIALPFLLWAGGRWGTRAAALGGLAVALVAYAGSASGQVYIVQAHLAVLLLASLAFAAAAGEQRRAETAAAASRGRLRRVVDSAPDAYMAVDAEGRITDWSARAEALFGWPAGDVVGRPLAETILPDAAPDASTSRPSVARDRSGREFPVRLAVQPAAEGEDRHIFVRDATENERLRDELEELTAQLAARSAELALAGRGRAQLAEDLRGTEAARGRTEQELVIAGRDLAAARQRLDALESELALARADRDRVNGELDGSARKLARLEAELESLRAEQARTTEELAGARSGRRRVEQVLEQARARFAEERGRLERSLEEARNDHARADAERRILGEHGSEAIASYDDGGTCLYASPAFRRLLGYEPGELVGRPGADLLHPHDRPRLWRARATGSETSFEARLLRKNGDFVWVEVGLRPSPDGGGGRMVALTVTIRDISVKQVADEGWRLARASAG